MRMYLGAGLVLVALLGGCTEGDRETGAADGERSGVDTMVQSSTVKDTTIVTADTSIDVDTVKQTDHIKKDSQ